MNINIMLKAAIESANDAIIITDVNLEAPGPIIEYVNPAFTKMTGWTLDEVMGKSPRMLQGPKTSRTLMERLKRDLINQGEFFGETVNYRKDGTEYFVEWRITPVKDETGVITKWVAIQRDVTDRVLAEEDLRKAKDEAEAASRAKDEFLATLSHELRTPLTAIVGWSSMIKKGYLDKDKMIEAGEIIERNAKAQAALIDDILDTSRIVTGRMKLNVNEIDIMMPIRAAVETIKSSAVEKNITFTLTGEEHQIIKADFGRIQQVIWNLLQNSIKFTPVNGFVDLLVDKVGKSIIIQVLDNGEGIDPKFLDHLFERFTQEETSSKRRHGGLGLGLAIVKNIITMHGGTISAHSEGKGKGSLFTITLPIEPVYHADNEHTPTGEVLTQTPEISLKGYHLMIIEDHEDSRAYIKNILKSYGALVSEASNVTEAEAIMRRERHDLVISDIGMPNRDGYSFIESLRRSEHRQQSSVDKIPCLALTAFASVDDMNKIIAAGFDAHLGKPVNPNDLISNVAKLLKI